MEKSVKKHMRRELGDNLSIFLQNNKEWIDRKKKEKADLTPEKSYNNSFELNEENRKLFEKYFSAKPIEEILPKGWDYKIFGDAVISILDLLEEDILTEKEANALVDFVVSKLIERRVNLIFQDFDLAEKFINNIVTDKLLAHYIMAVSGGAK